MSKSGQESHRAFVQSRRSGHDVRIETRNRVLATPTGACHTAHAPSFLLGIPPVRSPDCSEEVHVPDWAALLREGSCNHGFFVSGLIAWDTAVRWRDHEVYIANSLHQGEQHNPTLFSDFASHGQWDDAGCLNCRQGVCCHQDSCGRLGCFPDKRYEMYNAIFSGKALCSI
ncbi:hypothetical protein TcCL_Unassigned04569 [Trypanosoma cruzi]|nr:hypothetical protein TcCL_Unassigned04569 [Trypanosoma cruzi]